MEIQNISLTLSALKTKLFQQENITGHEAALDYQQIAWKVARAWTVYCFKTIAHLSFFKIILGRGILSERITSCAATDEAFFPSARDPDFSLCSGVYWEDRHRQ